MDRQATARQHVDPDIAVELAELLTHASRRLRRGATADMSPLGLTVGQARVLRAVADAGPMRMADLASHLEVVPRSATSVVDALESAGLVARRDDPGDRRSVRVALTDQGRSLLLRLDTARRRSADQLFAALAPAERAELRRLLSLLCDHGGCSTCGRGRPPTTTPSAGAGNEPWA